MILYVTLTIFILLLFPKLAEMQERMAFLMAKLSEKEKHNEAAV